VTRLRSFFKVFSLIVVLMVRAWRAKTD